jgi:hypothetical protein
MINELVDKVYVITTHDSTRVDDIKSHLIKNNIDVEFFVAPYYPKLDPTHIIHDQPDNSDVRPGLSLTMAFASIIEMSKLNSYDSICILEDDCFFSEGWERKMKTFYNEIHDDWDILHVGYSKTHETDSILKNVNMYVNIPIYWHYATHCMLLKNTVYDEWVNYVYNNEYYNEYSLPIDYYFNRIYKTRKYNCYSPVEKFIYQLSMRENIPMHDVGDIRYNSFLGPNTKIIQDE